MENKKLGKKRQSPPPTPAMVAYIKTICGEFGLENPNLRCFVSSKNFLDSEAPKEILKIQKIMTLFSKEMLPEMESSGIDDIERKREVLSKILVDTGENIGPKTVEKILNKGVPDLRKYGEGLFDDVGQKLLDNVAHSGFKKKSKAEEISVADGVGGAESAPNKIDTEKSGYKPNQLPKNNFAYDDLIKSSEKKDFMGFIERRVIEGYLSLVPTVNRVEYSDFYKTSDSFDRLKKSIKDNMGLDAVSERADNFLNNVSGNFKNETIDEKTCKSYKKILQSQLRELKDSELAKTAKEKVKGVAEILDKLVKFLSEIINRFLNTMGFSRS